MTATLFGSLKVEHLHGKKFMTVRAAKDAVIRWILWYNHLRQVTLCLSVFAVYLCVFPLPPCPTVTVTAALVLAV